MLRIIFFESERSDFGNGCGAHMNDPVVLGFGPEQ